MNTLAFHSNSVVVTVAVLRMEVKALHGKLTTERTSLTESRSPWHVGALATV